MLLLKKKLGLNPTFRPFDTAADQIFDNLTGTAKDLVADAISKGK